MALRDGRNAERGAEESTFPESSPDLSSLITARRMVRAFTPAPLPPGLLDRLLDTARRAPSAGNCQATTFVVLDRPELTKRYWKTTLPEPKRSGFRWAQLLDAPALVLILTEPERYPERYREPDKAAAGRTTIDDWPVPYWWVDAGAVIQNLLLLVTERRLGACLFGPFDHEPALRSEFDLPTGVRIVATVAIGIRADDDPGRSFNRPRRPRSEVIIRP